MKICRTSFPGIVAIGWVDATAIPKRVDLRAIVGQMPTVFAVVNWVDFFGEPVCSHTRVKDGHAVSESVELSFLSSSPLPAGRPVGVVVKGADDIYSNEGYLIGSAEEPYAALSFERTTGATRGEPNAYTVKVSHKAYRTFVKCKF